MAHWDNHTVLRSFWAVEPGFELRTSDSCSGFFPLWYFPVLKSAYSLNKHWNKSLGIGHFQYGQSLDWKCTVAADFYFIPDRKTHCHCLLLLGGMKKNAMIFSFFCLEVWCTRAQVIVLLTYERYLFALSYLEACNPVLKLSVLQGQLLWPTCL